MSEYLSLLNETTGTFDSIQFNAGAHTNDLLTAADNVGTFQWTTLPSSKLLASNSASQIIGVNTGIGIQYNAVTDTLSALTANGVNLYLNNNTTGQSPNPSSYKQLAPTPDLGTESSIITSLTTSPQLIASFLSDTDYPNSTSINIGSWNGIVYVSCSASSFMYFTISKVTGTTATLIATSATTTISTAASTASTIAVTPLTTILSTDRILVQFYAYAASTSTLTTYYDGTARASYVQSSFGYLNEILPVTNQTTVTTVSNTATIGTVQDIAATSTPTFNSLILEDAKSGAELYFKSGGVTKAYLYSDTTGDTNLYSAGSCDISPQTSAVINVAGTPKLTVNSASTITPNNLSVGSVTSTSAQVYVTADTGRNAITASTPTSWGAVLQNSGSSTSASLAGANFAALFAGGNIGVGTTNPYALMHLESANYGTPYAANSYRLITQGDPTFRYMSGIGQNSADEMFLNAKTTLRNYIGGTEILTLTAGASQINGTSFNINTNCDVQGVLTAYGTIMAYGVFSYDWVSVAQGAGYLSVNGQQSGNYSIQCPTAGGTYPMRFAGSSGASPQIPFDFGNYTGDNSGNTWNSRFKINSYSGNLLSVGSATFGGDVYTPGSIYCGGTFAAQGATNTAAAYTCYGSPSGDASSLSNYCLLMKNTGTPSTCTGIGLGYGSAGSEILWGNAYTAHQWYIQNSSKMYLTATGLGIGTVAPDTYLHVKGNSTGAYAATPTVVLQGDNTSNPIDLVFARGTSAANGQAAAISVRASNNDLAFYRYNAGWSETMRILNASGNVGIANISPYYTLSVGDTLGASSNTGYGEIYQNIYYGTGAWRNRTTGGCGLIQMLGGSGYGSQIGIFVGDATSATAAGTAQNLGYMVMSPGGVTGFGMSPTLGAKLWVKDAANTYANPQVRVVSNNGVVTSGLGFDGLYNTHALYFYTAGSSTAKMTIDTAGYVGIGVSPSYPLHVSAAVDDPLYVTTSYTNAFTRTITGFAPSIGNGQTTLIETGTAASSYNTSYFGHYRAGAGSSSNLITFGMYGIDHIMTMSGAGNVAIGLSTTPATSKLHVKAKGTGWYDALLIEDNNDGKCIVATCEANYFWLGGAQTVGGTVTQLFKVGLTGTASIGSGSPDASSVLELFGSGMGFKLPTTAGHGQIVSPIEGHMYWDSTNHRISIFTGAGGWKYVNMT